MAGMRRGKTPGEVLRESLVRFSFLDIVLS
jgi:hypothetical protein